MAGLSVGCRGYGAAVVVTLIRPDEIATKTFPTRSTGWR
jgi:hypothetical protein